MDVDDPRYANRGTGEVYGLRYRKRGSLSSFVIEIKQMDDYVDLAIYEKNADAGGTWFENHYPGLACDSPAHIYTFPFDPNPDWSALYASGPEI
ncbi:hypothetical protein SI65_00094 [Aspergillus cristatus]|uniref:Uncharacterized protein n=1 Tax=Aspergillus cristatus TaxID=573508 RepID=A0A1E3BQ44_ASPCR|nr:hypothetical protein SI65_00094 [Aspergillus cristatus]